MRKRIAIANDDVPYRLAINFAFVDGIPQEGLEWQFRILVES
jgi:hypothetical protein